MSKVIPNFRLKAIIISRGFSVKGFADKAGIHPKYLSAIIGGRYHPSQDLQKKIAKILKVKNGEVF